jgi:hypothetical protein
MRCHAFPVSADLFDSPELAIVAVLDTTVEVALIVLIVAYPDDELDTDELPLERRAARRLVTSLYDLSRAISRYRLALERAKERDRDRERTNDNPF